jgi:hypothetical protein
MKDSEKLSGEEKFGRKIPAKIFPPLEKYLTNKKFDFSSNSHKVIGQIFTQQK